MAKEYYKRKLPHWHPPNSVFALTYNLEGSIPKHILEQLKDEKEFQIKKLKEEGIEGEELQETLNKLHSLHFGKYDYLLDNPQNKIQHLKNPKVAQIVQDSLKYLNDKTWKMVCYCIMSNHVHLVVYKLNQPLTKILQRHKRHTAVKSNEILGKEGKFWQRETFDRKIRDRREFRNQVRYAVLNPVKAGLVNKWQDWKYTWIRKEYEYILK
ncbi:MAG: transposase [Saprospiraceae bacterium]